MIGEDSLTRLLAQEERRILLRLAREALECAAHGRKLSALDASTLTPALLAQGASFVTLTRHGDLRGCIGALEPYQPLAEDVREHTIAAALQDFRFPPVEPAELSDILIEVSRLTAPQHLDYAGPQDLLEKLRPGVDGIILSESKWRRATFLPQVWEKLPDKEVFLDHLCEKMGLPSNTWRTRHLDVQVYQVEEFHE